MTKKRKKIGKVHADKNKRKLEWEPQKLTVRKGNLFATSKVAEQIKNMPGNIFSETRKLIRKKMSHIERGAIVVSKNGRITVQKAYTGKFQGTKNFITMKVSIEGREFFVKIAKSGAIKANIEGLHKADAFLRKKGYRHGKFNLRVILPYKAISYKGVGYLATDFLRPEEVELVSDMKSNQGIKKCIESVYSELAKNKVFDTIPENAFYHKKTNTILLFDLISR